MGKNRYEERSIRAKWTSVSRSIPPERVELTRGRMVMWKHFVILFGGFIDVGVRSQSPNDRTYEKLTW